MILSLPRSRRRLYAHSARRRAAVAGLLTCLAATALAVAAPGSAAPSVGAGPSGDRPNIVFVLTDDLDTSLMAYMPHVQALAARGTSFSTFVVSDSLCCPSRASILTGEFPHNTGVHTNGGDGNGGFDAFHRLGDEQRTFGLLLHDAGYRTGFLGKYLNGYQPTNTVPDQNGNPGGTNYVPPGWDEWYGLGKAYRSYGYVANHNGHAEPHGKAPADYLNTVLQRQAVTFIKQASEGPSPFLLEVSSFTPHSPFTPAPQDLDRFPGLTAPRGPAWNTRPTDAPSWLAQAPALTDADMARIDLVFRKRVQAVQSVDRMVGALQDTLKAAGQLDRTVFVFSSDNGVHLGQYGLNPGKLTAFDTDIRVPLIVAGPGVRAGVTVPDLAQNVDLAPTFEQEAGVGVPDAVDGHSLVGVLTGDRTEPWQQLTFVEHTALSSDDDPDAQDPSQGKPPSYDAIRGRDFTYVQYADGEREYYDLTADPYELHNVAASLKPGRLAQLSATVAAHRTCVGAGCWRIAVG